MVEATYPHGLLETVAQTETTNCQPAKLGTTKRQAILTGISRKGY